MNTNFEKYLLNSLSEYDTDFNKLYESMNYTLKAGGKRFRPNLIFVCASALKLKESDVFDIAVAIELLHTYTLIHDDLPCLDNDDLRRGQASNHIVFGEDVSLLAGDALQPVAFKYIYKAIESGYDRQLFNYFSEVALRVVEGQSIDIDENYKNSIDDLKKIHQYKTGSLIEFCVVAPLFLTRQFDLIIPMKEIGLNLGVAFQIQDDILDFEGDSEQLGKSASDIDNNKCTYVSLLGIDKAKQLLCETIDAAKQLLEANNLYTEEFKKVLEVSMSRKK